MLDRQQILTVALAFKGSNMLTYNARFKNIVSCTVDDLYVSLSMN